MQNIRTFAQRSPMFCDFRGDVYLRSSSLHKKSFLKISYISYTHTPEFQYLLVISGVGLGVGLCFRV